MQSRAIATTTIRVDWEGPDRLGPGPRGDYLEVIDVDPATSAPMRRST